MTVRPVLALLLMVGAPAPAIGQELSYSGSLQYASGHYIFTEPTRTVSLYNGLALSGGRLRLSATLPVLLQNTGAVSVVGGTYLPTGGTGHGTVGGRQKGEPVPMGHGGGYGHGPGSPAITAAGRGAVQETVWTSSSIGSPALDGSSSQVQAPDSLVAEPGSYELSVADPLLAGGLEVHQGSGRLRSVELTASVKAPLNDLDSGVGTGEWDASFGLAAAVALGPTLAFLDVAYWWYGDLPELELQDGPSLGGGLGLPLTDRLWMSAMATFMNRVIETAEPARSASLALGYSHGDAGTLTLLASAGLSETAPDFSVSLGWRGTVISGR